MPPLPSGRYGRTVGMLLSRHDLGSLARAAGIADFNIVTVKLSGLTSNLILMARRAYR